MIKNDGMAKFNDNLQQVISGMFSSVQEDSLGKTWASACLDERISEFGNESLSRWTITLADGTQVTANYPMDAAHWMTMLIDIRNESFDGNDKFYGIHITKYPDGRSEVKFDYDPKCLSKMEV